MMDNLRAASSHVALKIILALIILSFVLTGMSSYLTGGSGDYAAKVNGQEIGRAQLEESVHSQRSRLQQQLGDQFSALAGSNGYMQQLRQESLNNLIDVTLLDQYSKKLGITVSDQQIKDAILATPQFQTDGRFDNAKYLQSIQGMGYSARSEERRVGKECRSRCGWSSDVCSSDLSTNQRRYSGNPTISN